MHPAPAPRHPCRASQTATGADIVIEERPASELKSVAGNKIAPDGIEAWNPAFDVTPAGLITAIVTDKGVVRPKQQGGGKEFDVKAFCASSAEVTLCSYRCRTAETRRYSALRLG